jgi:DNA repair exonuclease SbcCD nuclease subunit
MQIALLTDTHYGARGDSQAFDNFFRKFYDEVFFPELKRRDVKNIFHLGDCFDRRKYINFDSLRSCREYFFDKTIEENICVDMIVGNHDTYYKNTNNVNSPELLLNDYFNVAVYKKPDTITIGGRDILVLPWICTDNYEESVKHIKETKAKVCFGHLELEGFQMWKGQENKEGFDPKHFANFDLVCSGHFHHRHTKGNITYLGNPYEMFWNDYDDERGFHIFDTETLDLEFIPNPNKMFLKLYYNDEKELPAVDNYEGKIVKFIVVNKTDSYKYDQYLDNLYKVNPIEVKIVEDFSEFESDLLDDEDVDISDTLTLLSQYVDALETEVDKERLKGLMKTLYVESQDYE